MVLGRPALGFESGIPRPEGAQQPKVSSTTCSGPAAGRIYTPVCRPADEGLLPFSKDRTTSVLSAHANRQVHRTVECLAADRGRR
jgi:hypothetical protein